MISIRKFFLAAALTVMTLPAAAGDFCGRSPVVDGEFSELEWAGAAQYSFDMKTPEGLTVPAEIWITNDAEQLYVAIRHPYTAVTDNSARVIIDANHSGVTDADDDALVANWNQWGQIDGFDSFYGLPNCTGCAGLDAQHGGTNDIAVGATTQNGWHTTELSHPFTGRDARDLRASGGQYIALQFANRVFNASGEMADTEFPVACPRYVVYRLRDCNLE
ncbi:MAG TPA: hypothetical protein VGF48_18625 [Thermoanaerobaculia bacterium]|jgi:hypothetical protein